LIAVGADQRHHSRLIPTCFTTSYPACDVVADEGAEFLTAARCGFDTHRGKALFHRDRLEQVDDNLARQKRMGTGTRLFGSKFELCSGGN
jgi:hypothetical protein